MLILTINSGSQTLKYKLYEAEDFKVVGEGKISDIGFGTVKNHQMAILEVKKALQDHLEEIKIVGHRYVNGGTEFINPEIINNEKLKKLEKYNGLAPLHNPHNLEGIKGSLEIFKEAINIAVFDTAFYKDLPEVAWRYGLNLELALKNGYRRMGFHGISHRYVINKAAEKLGKELKNLKLISLHLGGGASITAVKGGRAVDTSMGFTPLEGLMMMTRSGDIDPGIILDLMTKGKNAAEIDQILNNKSGIYGICGRQGMLEILDNLEDPRVKLAFDMYIYRIKKYIGAYSAILGECDAIIFTGTVGAGRKETREAVMKDLKLSSNPRVLAIQTDEEVIIAKDALDKYQEINN